MLTRTVNMNARQYHRSTDDCSTFLHPVPLHTTEMTHRSQPIATHLGPTSSRRPTVRALETERAARARAPTRTTLDTLTLSWFTPVRQRVGRDRDVIGMSHEANGPRELLRNTPVNFGICLKDFGSHQQEIFPPLCMHKANKQLTTSTEKNAWDTP